VRSPELSRTCSLRLNPRPSDYGGSLEHYNNIIQQIGRIATGTVERFIQERIYLKNVTPKTIEYYRDSFHAFDGAMESKATVGERITILRNRGLSPISVNSYLRAVNAFFRWAFTEGHLPELIRIPKLKEPQHVLATLSAEQVQRLIQFKPHGKNQHRIHAIACLLLDTGMRIDEALSLRREHVDIDNLLIRVHGKGRKDRVVPMSLEMQKVMWKWMRRGGRALNHSSNDHRFRVSHGDRPETGIPQYAAGLQDYWAEAPHSGSAVLVPHPSAYICCELHPQGRRRVSASAGARTFHVGNDSKVRDSSNIRPASRT
jgi:site-specific recombinase XerD